MDDEFIMVYLIQVLSVAYWTAEKWLHSGKAFE